MVLFCVAIEASAKLFDHRGHARSEVMRLPIRLGHVEEAPETIARQKATDAN